VIYLGNRWMTKAVRMIREKRSRVGSMIPVRWSSQALFRREAPEER
jgi:hypothetical protein